MDDETIGEGYCFTSVEKIRGSLIRESASGFTCLAAVAGLDRGRLSRLVGWSLRSIDGSGSSVRWCCCLGSVRRSWRRVGSSRSGVRLLSWGSIRLLNWCGVRLNWSRVRWSRWSVDGLRSTVALLRRTIARLGLLRGSSVRWLGSTVGLLRGSVARLGLLGGSAVRWARSAVAVRWGTV